MMGEVKQWLDEEPKFSSDKVYEINQWITAKKASIRHTILKTMLSSADYYLQSFRRTIETRWAIQSQLTDLYDTISELEQIIENYMSVKTNRLISLITIFGFPFVLFSGLFEIIFADVPSPSWFGIHWSTLTLFIGFSLLGTWALNRYVKSTSNESFIEKQKKRR